MDELKRLSTKKFYGMRHSDQKLKPAKLELKREDAELFEEGESFWSDWYKYPSSVQEEFDWEEELDLIVQQQDSSWNQEHWPDDGKLYFEGKTP